jgi:hypothetical protein
MFAVRPLKSQLQASTQPAEIGALCLLHGYSARNKNGSEQEKASGQAQRGSPVAETLKADATTLSE